MGQFFQQVGHTLVLCVWSAPGWRKSTGVGGLGSAMGPAMSWDGADLGNGPGGQNSVRAALLTGRPLPVPDCCGGSPVGLGSSQH